MHTRKLPEQLVWDLVDRSSMFFKMAAVIYDNGGIFSWGWNHGRVPYSTDAEAHAISRANRRRLHGASIVVAGMNARNGKVLYAKPCDDCLARIRAAGISKVKFSDCSSPTDWNEMKI